MEYLKANSPIGHIRTGESCYSHSYLTHKRLGLGPDGGEGREIWGARWAGLQYWGGLYAIVLVMEKGSVAWFGNGEGISGMCFVIVNGLG